ncbi:PapD-like protein [Coniella lustricola]|uniref:PapD-like protein n=1 Tax=Coniella lustricola TaxID=2025994 RepID=A0A2T3AHZ7_9PEZI|nr:PapD-like protein [Coniella lustricola]
MSVDIEPFELGFRRPFTVEVSQLLKLKNPNKQPVAFKVKTTAPKQYCVRPNSGRIEPGHEVEVTVLLQAMKEDPPLDAKCRDKFLVQSVIITSDLEFSNVQTIWDSVDKSSVQEKKIRVTFLPANGGSEPAGFATPVKPSHLTNGIEQTPAAAYTSPEEKRPTSSDAASAEGLSEFHDEPEVTAPIAQPPLVPQQESSRSTATAIKAESEGLRQRKEIIPEAKAAVAELASAVQPRATEGVPIQLVAILCLVSFLLAYFFF